MTGPCTRNALHERVGWTCPDCGHHGLAHPGANPGTRHCILCELAHTQQAAADTDRWLQDQANELDGLLMELRHELDTLRRTREQHTPPPRHAHVIP